MRGGLSLGLLRQPAFGGVQIVICYENLLVLFLFGEQAFDFGAERAEEGSVG